MNAVIEAMACGLPVVTSDRRELRETVSEKTAILVDPHSIEELREGIGELVRDRERRERMGEAGRAHVSGVSLEQRAMGIIDWLQTIVDKGRSTS